MDDVFVYVVNLPPGIHEAVMPCADGYTIYLSGADARSRQVEAYNHAICHIRNGDFDKYNVQEIESGAHEEV